MKLLRAHFENFRLLRDLELEFSSKPNANLTVIRAANESGKTTILHGLQWALYGDRALPGSGKSFRLHPIDWSASEGKRVPITATVEFELTKHHRSRTLGRIRKTRHRYRLIRSAFEDVDSKALRSNTTVNLFELNRNGASPINAPEALINDELPPELREVFFTDGDRALSFIEADVAQFTKRERVRQAIRSLLGLGVIEDAIYHVRKSSAEVNKKAKRIGGGSELKKTAKQLEDMENLRETLEADLKDAKQQFRAFDERVSKIDRKIEEALQKGDKVKLSRELNRVREDIKLLHNQLSEAKKAHSNLFRSESIATDLLAPILTGAFDILELLHDQGKIPNSSIPVLKDRLEADVCICGETLRHGDIGSDKRRAHIEKLIGDSQRADEIQKTITDLYYSTKPLQTGGQKKPKAWLDEYMTVAARRDAKEELLKEAGRKLRALENQLDSLPDTDILGLRETRRNYNQQRDRYLSKESTIDTKLKRLRSDCEKLKLERDRLLREQKKGARILAELAVTKDVLQVLRNAYEHITNEELNKVSVLMNWIFLEMIGADPEQGSIIQRAEISQEFDILVYGLNDKTLNPDRDLNGASRRALTLAFILALTRVSGVEAPNVIDTPLGMTSGYVKRSILRTVVRESTQVILFLTHAEIAGCEDIIDEARGAVYTLTNPAHYPRMLVNDPGVFERKVLRCSCNHRSNCEICLRRMDAEDEGEIAS